MNYNGYGAFSRRTLFPPVVPTSIPAFDGNKMYKIFFKRSAANFLSGGGVSGSFKHIQISIRRVNNNSNAVDTAIHKTGYIITPLSTKAMDNPGFEPEAGNVYRVYGRDEKTPYGVFLNSEFKELNTLYKVQIRLGEEEYNPNWTVADVQRMNAEGTVSEWSTVLTMKPIDPPNFGIQGFTELGLDPDKKGNTIATANYEYIGYYDSTFIQNNAQGVPVVSTVNEKLSEYWFKLYDAAGRELAKSEPIVTIEHDRPNLSYTFNYLTQDLTDYFVTFGVKTENGYVGEKKYYVKANYKVLQMSNAMVKVTNDRDFARMKVEVQAKQVVLEPIVKKGTNNEMSKLGFVKDETDPQYKDLGILDQQKRVSTHAVIEGSVETSRSFYLSCPNDTWVLECKLSGLKSFPSREEALKNPYMVLENDFSIEKDVLYLTRVSLICYEKEEFNFDVDHLATPVVDQNGIKRFPKRTSTPKKVYYLEAVKTSYKKQMGREIEIATQVSKVRSAIKTSYKWPSSVPEIPYGTLVVKPSANRYEYEEGKYQIKDVPATKALDIKYFNSSNPNAPIVETGTFPSRKTIGVNNGVEFNPRKEYYIYLSNNLGSMELAMFDDGYITTSQKLIQYLDTKVVTEDMDV